MARVGFVGVGTKDARAAFVVTIEALINVGTFTTVADVFVDAGAGKVSD